MARIHQNLRITGTAKVLPSTDARHGAVRHAQLEALRGLLRSQVQRGRRRR